MAATSMVVGGAVPAIGGPTVTPRAVRNSPKTRAASSGGLLDGTRGLKLPSKMGGQDTKFSFTASAERGPDWSEMTSRSAHGPVRWLSK